MGIDVSNLSKDSPLRKKIEEKKNDTAPQVQDKQKAEMQHKRAFDLIEPATDFTHKKVFKVDPMGKPRMTQRDKWKKRPVVERYRAFCDKIRLDKKKFELPLHSAWIIMFYPMPKSWSKAKKRRHNGRFHMQRPDVDNMTKALFDALLEEDSIVADARITKIWCYRGKARIEVRY